MNFLLKNLKLFAIGAFFCGVVFFGFSGQVLANSNFVAGELLFKFKNNPRIYRIKTDDTSSLQALIKKYSQLDEIEYLEPNYKFTQAAFPNDENYYQQWYNFQIKARDAWSQDLLSHEQLSSLKKPVIAILDSGVYIDHPDLKNKIWKNTDEITTDGIDNDKNGYIDDMTGWNFVENNSNVNPVAKGSYVVDAINHGTLVAGIAAAENNNNQGGTGVSWFARIMPIKVLDNVGDGDVYSVIQAIDYALNNGADVINMSFIGTGYSQSLAEAIKRANNRGVVVVAAAGNSDARINGSDMTVNRAYPVCYDGSAGENLVIGVASIGKNLTKSKFSNYGDCVDLAAPGEDIFSTLFYQPGHIDFNAYYGGGWSGTSLAVPMVSATVATLKALRPDLSVNDIRNFIISNTDNIYTYNIDYVGKLGSGILNVSKTISAALSGSVPIKTDLHKNNYLLVGLGLKSFPQIKILKADNSVFKSFFTYSPNFKGEISAVSGDVNGDGINEVITYPGQGGGPHVRVLTVDGQLVAQFFAYDKYFYNGISVVVGDVDGNGSAEIITAPAKGIKAEVKIFNKSGSLIKSFLPYENFNGGVDLAACDINRDGQDEIITGPNVGNLPLVKIFNRNGELLHQFYAFNSNFKSGVNVACGDVHGDKQPEIIASLGKNNQPKINIYNYLGDLLNSFFANEIDYYYGINIAIGDIDGDSIGEILVGNGNGSEPRLKAFDLSGKLKFNNLVHTASYRGGVRPSFISY